MGNKVATKQLESEKSTSSAKHVDIRFKLIYHQAQDNVVQPRFVKSDDMMVDLLTNALPAPMIYDQWGMFKSKDVEEE